MTASLATPPTARGLALAIALLVVLLLGGCSRVHSGSSRHGDARQSDDRHAALVASLAASPSNDAPATLARFDALIAELRADGDEAPPRLVRDRALAALAAGAYAEAEASARALTRGADAALAADGWFVLGAAAVARADLARAQATGPEAEPFAFDAAIALAERGRDAFVRAVLVRERWDAAARNAERARRRVAVWSAERDGREPPDPRTIADGAPDVQLVPDAADDGGGGGDDASGPDARGDTALTELSPAELERLLERLATDERERLEARARRRAERSKDVEQDW